MNYIVKNSKKYGKNVSRGKYCPRFNLRYQAEANTVRAFFYAIKQRQILSALSSTLSSRGKYCPRFLLRCQAEANTVRAFFFAINQRQILSTLSFTLSSRGKYWPRFLLRCQAEANTGRAFFFPSSSESCRWAPPGRWSWYLSPRGVSKQTRAK